MDVSGQPGQPGADNSYGGGGGAGGGGVRITCAGLLRVTPTGRVVSDGGSGGNSNGNVFAVQLGGGKAYTPGAGSAGSATAGGGSGGKGNHRSYGQRGFGPGNVAGHLGAGEGGLFTSGNTHPPGGGGGPPAPKPASAPPAPNTYDT